MIWCSLRFEDGVQTDVRQWNWGRATICGRSRCKGGRVRDWVIANYSIGERAWLLKWYQMLLTVPPHDRDCILNDIEMVDDDVLRWKPHQLTWDTASQIFHQVMCRAAAIAAADVPDSAEEINRWAADATIHWLRAIIPTLGGMNDHPDRAVRFQGDWTQNSPMPDHYTKVKLAISLKMVGSLVKDLKMGWRPGIEAIHDLIPDKGAAPRFDDARDPMPSWDSEDEDAALTTASIAFYTMNASSKDKSKKFDLQAHVPDLEEPDKPACTRLKNANTRLSDLFELDGYPESIKKVCGDCLRRRPEIREFFDAFL